MDRKAVEKWVDGYERAWRAAGTDGLADLFAPEAGYLIAPWAEPILGLAAIAEFWDDEREGPDEDFTMESEVVAVEGETAVVRVEVEYGGAAPIRWRDMWILRFNESERCIWFEEWAFPPDPTN
ncbi:YybH family protein [Nocardia arthritidis]|uniref:Nuclear transport factor 2 family protein n=1 Tax=Nocardia arthritidis TaxID=228602 RepID=A0A6G9YQ52_9NOCA|nr:nuclear transport factor 2 family protein [Nocardia arthritidis]QIS15217.1 nuclear transport factor 2 family protein [Nocardia arthritidis]